MANLALPDIQLTKPEFEIAINKVGINNLLLPIFVVQKNGGYQNSTASIDCCVSLDSTLKGISMSRIPRTVHTYLDLPLGNIIIKKIVDDIILKTECENVHLVYKFPYFVKKYAPESKEPGFVHHTAIFEGVKINNEYKFNVGVEVIATNLCPCSKSISKYGAHNQRVHIRIKAEQKNDSFLWLEDLITIAETSTSCEIYSILKREDEKYVTEKAYNNPMFVEDVARACYNQLSKLSNIERFKIDVNAQESIHLHSAYASISKS